MNGAAMRQPKQLATRKRGGLVVAWLRLRLSVLSLRLGFEGREHEYDTYKS